MFSILSTFEAFSLAVFFFHFRFGKACCPKSSNSFLPHIKPHRKSCRYPLMNYLVLVVRWSPILKNMNSTLLIFFSAFERPRGNFETRSASSQNFARSSLSNHQNSEVGKTQNWSYCSAFGANCPSSFKVPSIHYVSTLRGGGHRLQTFAYREIFVRSYYFCIN